MSVRDVLRLATGALTGHRLRSVLSLLGVAIGVAAVMVLTSLGEGARQYVVGEFASLGSNLVVVIPGKNETTGFAPPLIGGTIHDLTVEDADALPRRVRQIRRAAPLMVGTATAHTGERSREVTVAGTTVDMMRIRKFRIGAGSYLPPGETTRSQRVCVLGTKLREELYPGINPLGKVLRLGEERYRIIGVMAPRGTSLGMNLDEVVHIPVESSLRMFNRRSLFRILLEVSSHEQIEYAKQAAIEVLKERHDGIEDVTLFTQDAVLTTFGRILGILTAALAGIAAISLSVAGIGIMNVMLVSVSERRGEIGLLKALGATEGQVLAAFLVEAALLSTAGGAGGLAVGLGGTALIGAIYPSFPVQVPVWAVAGALGLSLAVGMVFGALPARRAARLDPVVALSGK